MAISQLYMADSSEKLYKYSAKDHSHKSQHRSKGTMMPSFAFVLSIVIYTSVFYVFKISPSNLFSNTKFWFFISNTLILIIAADYGSFSSRNCKGLDLYEEFAAAQSRRRPYPVYVLREVNDDEKSQEKIVRVVEPENGAEGKEIVVALQGDPLQQSEEETVRNEVFDDEDKLTSHDKSNEEEKVGSEEDDGFEETRMIVVVPEEHGGFEEKGMIKWSNTGDEKGGGESDDEFDDEYSAMSDEELNRRVEEFILKLKRQIRLQGVRQ